MKKEQGAGHKVQAVRCDEMNSYLKKHLFSCVNDAEVCPSLPQDKLARDDDSSTTAG